MQLRIHPAYETITITCGGCKKTYQVGSTLCRNLDIEVCANCHPFYTGKQKLVDSSGTVERFMKKYGNYHFSKNVVTQDSE